MATGEEIEKRFARGFSGNMDMNKALQVTQDLERAYVRTAMYLNEELPEGRNKAIALTKLHESLLFSVESIAKDGV